MLTDSRLSLVRFVRFSVHVPGCEQGCENDGVWVGWGGLGGFRASNQHLSCVGWHVVVVGVLQCWQSPLDSRLSGSCTSVCMCLRHRQGCVVVWCGSRIVLHV